MGVKKRILIAEDESLNRLFFTKLLKKDGFSVEEACNGLEAISKAMAKCFDLIIMDLRMPLLDGIEVIMQIRRDKDGVNQETPIIAVSSDSYGGSACVSEMGKGEFISKPVTGTSLIRRVRFYTGSIDD